MAKHTPHAIAHGCHGQANFTVAMAKQTSHAIAHGCHGQATSHAIAHGCPAHVCSFQALSYAYTTTITHCIPFNFDAVLTAEVNISEFVSRTHMN
jgi:hypothetical protein